MANFYETITFCVKIFNAKTKRWELDTSGFKTFEQAKQHALSLSFDKENFCYLKARVVERLEQTLDTTIEDIKLKK